MRIGVISDTHMPANCDSIYEKISKYFTGVDMILHAGDLTELSVLEELKKFTLHIEAVRGNMDCSQAQKKLPQKKIIQAEKYKIGLTHGSGSARDLAKRIILEFKDVDVIVFGHSHQAINEKKNGVLLFNPGSPTDTVFAEKRTIGILEINDKIKGEIITI